MTTPHPDLTAARDALGDRITMDRASVEAFSVALAGTPPTPDPDRLRALEAALERLRVATNDGDSIGGVE